VPRVSRFPSYAGPDQLGAVDCRRHVQAFREMVQPPVLSYDQYALIEWGDRPEFLANLEVIRRQSGKMSGQRTGGSP